MTAALTLGFRRTAQQVPNTPDRFYPDVRAGRFELLAQPMRMNLDRIGAYGIAQAVKLVFGKLLADDLTRSPHQ